MSDSTIVRPDGRPARKAESDACPRCGAGKDRRVNTAGFGPPIVCCGNCGHFYEGAIE